VPSWSHDGERVVYTSVAGVIDGRPDHGPMDLRIIPYADGAGGISTPLAGAAEPAYNEFYPAYSPDDAWVAFARVPDAQASYDAPLSEVFVVPASGGKALRLRANDAAACSSKKSPGMTNSWPKWSPSVSRANGKSYYFVTFSSRRRGLPQLFVTALVDDGRTLTSYPASYLWNQPADEGNHTPDWSDVHLPEIPK
jgi:Tol biopolymer transport system component